ncbi:hypothetical protein B0I35DRAFT_437872 [Stachybotrys elegans]|uniref:Zn(2)-C6 fungal-type domain-containing protein n=1 Tax=Stachybotrys elegans TaxID=80388 RepID=A0A8K0WNE3_9HYPO|nr:hypothetical protein B0I35DRAFT_437872 [Stachybotrys elegans]
MTDTETPQQEPPRQRAKHTRTRNGCERCRARRRKCDERKPVCSRCADASAQCHYARHETQNNHDDVLPGEEPRAATATTGPRLELSASGARSGVPLDAAGLLHHYHRHVSPWLDIFDRDQTFARLVPRFGAASPLVLSAVMQLAATSSGVSCKGIGLDGHLTPHAIAPTAHAASLQIACVFTLQRAREFMEAVPTTWKTVFAQSQSSPDFMPYDFDRADHRQILLSMVALMSRLEIAHAMMHETAPSVEPKVLWEVVEAFELIQTSHEAFTTMKTVLRCIYILIDVTRLCFGATDTSASSFPLSNGPGFDKWQALLNDLLIWYSGRPPDFHPFLQADGQGGAFPTIVFTTDAAACASMMYHSAMLILLSYRQNSARIASQYGQPECEPAELLPLWHARRVCGIALSSDQLCWDPCMIAAFTSAARRMTHPDQYGAILRCLKRVEASGWPLGDLMAKLRQEWLYDME